MIKYGTLALLCAFGIAFSAGALQAQTIDTGTVLDVNAGAGSNGTSGNADVSGSVDTSTSVDSEEEGTAEDDSMTTSADTSGIFGFSLMRDSLDADVSGDTMIQTAAEVSTNETFRAYAENSLKSDARFEGVVVNEDGMDLTYKRDARFLALVPSEMTVRVHIDDSGAVEVKYPWYAFLMTSGESSADLEARIADDIASATSSMQADASGDVTAEANDTSASGSASVSASADVERWALILERVQQTLSADASVEAS